MPYVLVLFAGIIVLALRSPNHQLVDTWKMVKVVEKENDITKKLNPNNDRWISFRADKTFESDDTPYGKNTGTYTLDKTSSVLSLFSDAGEGDNSQWKIRFTTDSMVWKGIGSERQESTLVHYIKVKK